MIYFMRHPDTGLIKIGTTVNIYNRLSQLITQHGDLELMGLLEGSYETESELHKRFADCHESNADGREWFRAESSLLDFIETNTHLSLPSQQQMTTVRVSRRTQHALNTIAGMLPKGTTAEDVILEALRNKYPDVMKKIAEIQSLSVEQGNEETA